MEGMEGVPLLMGGPVFHGKAFEAPYFPAKMPILQLTKRASLW